MLPSEVPVLAIDPLVRVFPGVWKLLSLLRLPSPDGSQSLPLLSLFISFIFFLPPFEECLMSSASIQKMFCGTYSAFKCSFDEFVGEKVVSPSYSSAILGLLPPYTYFNAILLNHPTLAFYHTIQKSVLYTCVSFAALHIGLPSPSF